MTDFTAPCEEKINDDDAAIAAALEHTSIPALMMSMIHMSGDPALMDADIKPGMAFMGEIQGFLSAEQQTEIRQQALNIICAYRDRGCTLPEAPDKSIVHKMMQFIVGDEVAEEYVDMMIEDTSLYGKDERAFTWDKPVSDSDKKEFKVLVIGAGQSGILAGIRLNEAGINYTIVEKNQGIGGTWWENNYPGARVDVANHFYSYSFEPNHDWPEHYSRQPQLAAYFDRCADKYKVKQHIQFETEVISCDYLTKQAQWSVVIRKADGTESTERYHAVISAAGQLNRQKYPDIEGMDSFKGQAFHSSRWDWNLNLKGKRIAVIGTGASAFQLVPEIAKSAGHVTVYQRSPNWMFPNDRYHQSVADGKIWALKNLPYYGRWYRFLHFWMTADKTHALLFSDPNWEHKDRAISEANDFTRIMFTDYLKEQCGNDTALLDKVLPTYPPMGKRTLQDNGSWLGALKRDNVELITHSVSAVNATGVTDETGAAIDVDVIVYATGFYASRFLWPMKITGKNGEDLHQQWQDDPKTNLGITTPNFPNFFCVYGPGNNLGHGGSLIFYSECQIRYILECFKTLVENKLKSIECRPEASEAYYQKFTEAADQTVWAHKGMDNWYKNKNGKVVTTSPWRLIDFWRWTKQPELSQFYLD